MNKKKKMQKEKKKKLYLSFCNLQSDVAATALKSSEAKTRICIVMNAFSIPFVF